MTGQAVALCCLLSGHETRAAGLFLVKAENNLDKGVLTTVSCKYLLQNLPECLSPSVITWDVAERDVNNLG